MYKTIYIRVNCLVEQDKRGKEVYKQRYCDIEELSSEIEETCNRFESAGYHLVSITPIIRGFDNVNMHLTYGYSVTDGVITLFKINR
jgi:hypothetical protein